MVSSNIAAVAMFGRLPWQHTVVLPRKPLEEDMLSLQSLLEPYMLSPWQVKQDLPRAEP